MPRFCTALHQGQPCTRRALPGQAFCYGHHPNPVDFRQCEFFNRKGRRCRSTTLRGQRCCFTHSPRNRRAIHPPPPWSPAPPAKRPRQSGSFSSTCHSAKWPSWNSSQIMHLPESHRGVGEGVGAREPAANWPLVAGYSPVAAGRRLLAAGCWPPAAGCWLLAAGESLALRRVNSGPFGE
jgi:hypothetical protein